MGRQGDNHDLEAISNREVKFNPQTPCPLPLFPTKLNFISGCTRVAAASILGATSPYGKIPLLFGP